MNICIDASLVIKCLVPEEGSDTALQLLEKWNTERATFIAPGLLDYEVGTTIRQKIIRGFLKEEHLYPIFDYYKRLNIKLFHLSELVSQAVAIASSLYQSTIYDVSYLLVAKEHRANFVTADKKFYEAAHPLFSFVKYYKELV